MVKSGIGFETIGNATLIVYDAAPILVTDPWIEGDAFFRSWALAYDIPEEQRKAILAAEYVWISHGHPDHLSSASLEVLKGKKILLADHVGNRIRDGLMAKGFEVHVLKDRLWQRLSDNVRVLCIADYNQDSILLVDVAGKLIVNMNDASDRAWGQYVRSVTEKYEVSFLLSLTGYGDADMMNLYDEQGRRLINEKEYKKPFGHQVAALCERFGAKYFIPFSSMHTYQRQDSAWANEITTPVQDHKVGFKSKSCEILPAFVSYDCQSGEVRELHPVQRQIEIIDPESIGDSWSDCLEKSDWQEIDDYFRVIEHVDNKLGFIRFRVGGEEHCLQLSGKDATRGVTFEVPRNSLMTAIRYEVFDDLLIGNFMKTTLHGDWPPAGLYPDFTPFVAKYADNGGVKSRQDYLKYLKEYQKRAILDYLTHPFELSRQKKTLRLFLPPETPLFNLARWTYRTSKKCGSLFNFSSKG